ncbi:protein of unknown function (plasmid) [Caballeronia sp. S22]
MGGYEASRWTSQPRPCVTDSIDGSATVHSCLLLNKVYYVFVLKNRVTVDLATPGDALADSNSMLNKRRAAWRVESEKERCQPRVGDDFLP